MVRGITVGVCVLSLMFCGCKESAEEPQAKESTTVPSEVKKPTTESPLNQAEQYFAGIFNGKDLTGWSATGGSGGAKWVVQDGAIIGTQGEGNAAGDLLTEKSYKNFELIVVYKIDWPANSGVWFRYQSPEKAYQADILEYKDPECYSGTLYCPGKMFLAMNTNKTLVNREGWNLMKIRAESDHLQIWLNNKQVADVHDDTSDSGRIGFQVHAGDEFSSMKIVVKEIMLQEL